jgi:Transposase
LQVTLEEGTCAAWLHDLLKPHVTGVLVCDPRKNALLKSGNKNDRIDARKLADLLRTGLLSPVYHGEAGVRTLKELARRTLARKIAAITLTVWKKGVRFDAQYLKPQTA